jgi:hypothetical protein
VTRIINITAALISTALLWFAALHILNVDKTFASITIYLFLSYPPSATHSMAGLETILFSSLLIAQSITIVKYIKSGSNIFLSLFLFIGILSSLTRPEGIALTLIWLVTTYLFCGRSRDVDYSFFGFSIFILLWFGARFWYFGYLLPNSFFVKAGENMIRFPGWRTIVFFYLSNAPIIVLIIIHMVINKYDRTDNFLLIPIGFFTIFYAAIIHLTGFAHRFMFPIYSMLVLLNVKSLANLFRIFDKELIPQSTFTSWIKRVALLLLFLVVLQPDNLNSPQSSSIRLGKFLFIDKMPSTKNWTDINMEIGKFLGSLNLRENLICLGEDAGAMPYFSGCSFIDPIGLTDNVIARVKTKEEFVNYIFGKNPDIILFRAEDQKFDIEKEKGRQIPQGGHGALGRYEKKSLYQDKRFALYDNIGSIPDEGDFYHWQFFVNTGSKYFSLLKRSLNFFVQKNQGWLSQ